MCIALTLLRSKSAPLSVVNAAGPRAFGPLRSETPGAAWLPGRVKLLRWGQNPSTQGPVLVGRDGRRRGKAFRGYLAERPAGGMRNFHGGLNLRYMNVFRNLTAAVTRQKTDLWQAQMAVSDEPGPGFIRQVQFNGSGVMLISGKARAFVPLRELFKLAEATDKRFRAPAGRSPRGTHAAMWRMVSKVRSGRLRRRRAK